MPGTTTPGVRLINLTPALRIAQAAQSYQPTGEPNDEQSFAQSVSDCIAVLEATINSFVLFIDRTGPESFPPSMGQPVAIDDHDPAAGHLVVIDEVGPQAMALVRFTARTIARMVHQRRATEDNGPVFSTGFSAGISTVNHESVPDISLHEMISKSSIGIARVGLHGRIEWCNTGMGTMLGVDADSLIGMHVDDLSPDDDPNSRGVSGQFIAEALANKTTSKTFSKTVKHADGHRMRVEINSRLVTDEDTGAPAYFLSLVNDVTDRFNTDHGVWQAEKMEAIGQVAANLAHDINNLLGGILGYSEILMQRLDDEAARQECSVITTTALRAAEVTKQLLRFARQSPLMPDAVNLHEMIATTVDASVGSHADADGHLVRFDLQLNASSSDVFGDRDALKFVVDQVVANARTAIAAKSSRTPGSIRIDTDNVVSEPNTSDPASGAAPLTSRRQLVRMRITDDGIGMDEVTLRRAFEPFFSTSGIDGAGIGLASVHATIVNHGGSITATSIPGGGTTFTIMLPVHPQPASVEVHESTETVVEPVNAPAAFDPTPTILVVDDDDVMRSFVVAALGRSGFYTIDFDNGPDAIEYFSAHKTHIELAICDMVMPDMSGHELVNELRQHDPNVAVLMATGIDKNTPDPELGELNAPVIQKPFRMAHLIEAVNSLID